MTKDELREVLADLEHDRWSRWIKYLFSKCKSSAALYISSDGADTIIPSSLVRRWMRQIETTYENLSEKEKDSDRIEADKTLEVVWPLIEEAKAETRVDIE